MTNEARGAGLPSWSLSPQSLTVAYGQAQFMSETGKPAASGWFGPLAPLAPIAPKEVAGRAFDFPSGYNIATRPRSFEPISVDDLRALAETYDLLRIVIETRKDQVERLPWSLRVKPGKQGPGAARLDELTAFFERPDREHDFSLWLRMLLEDLFVLDSPTLWRQRRCNSELYALHPLDGATIKRVIDDWGRTPQPYKQDGEPIYPAAYQQILKGYPAINYSARDIIYAPRNMLPHRIYGLSPVEQIVMTVATALKRQTFTLTHFTEGNIPESLIGVPESWTPDQIKNFQDYWDAHFTGDLAARRRAKFVPGGVAKTFIQTKEPELKGAFDEWLARVVCYAFSVSPQAFVSQVSAAVPAAARDCGGARRLQALDAFGRGARSCARCFLRVGFESAGARSALRLKAVQRLYKSNCTAMEITRRNVLLAAALAPFPGASARAETLLVFPPETVSHDPGPGAADRPERLNAVRAALAQERFGALARMTAPRASDEQILRVHSRALMAKLEAATPKDGVRWLDRDLAMSPGSLEAALDAAGGGALAVERVLAGAAQNAFVAARPPGHHARPNAAMGFCFFNNAAIATRHAMAKGAERVAIVDFDVHHGSGLQEIFWNEKNVLYCSTHQSPLYPGTGAVNECGAFENIVNTPLVKGDGGAAFSAAMRERILPRAEDFRPDLILICAGFDAHLHDPLGGLRLVEEDFRAVTLRLMEIAARRCAGRIVSLLEGGYRPEDLASSVAAHVDALMEA